MWYFKGMKSGDVIKHPSFLDLCCYVSDVYHERAVVIYWMNQGFVESWFLGRGSQTVNPTGWLVCDNPKAKCVRYENWSVVC